MHFYSAFITETASNDNYNVYELTFNFTSAVT